MHLNGLFRDARADAPDGILRRRQGAFTRDARLTDRRGRIDRR
jgi:hypothetical protein